MTAAVSEPVAHRDAAGVLWVPITGAAVPDPRFRDQLAVVLVRLWGCEPDDVDAIVAAYDVVDALLPLIAAEVEARVQAAANQRAAEIVTRVKAIPTYTLTNDDKPLGTVVLADDVLAALASPAPAPRAEEG